MPKIDVNLLRWLVSDLLIFSSASVNEENIISTSALYYEVVPILKTWKLYYQNSHF